MSPNWPANLKCGTGKFSFEPRPVATEAEASAPVHNRRIACIPRPQAPTVKLPIPLHFKTGTH
jgi:hypothetical protein